MMDVLEKVEKTELLGRDFLVWLWFKSQTNNGIIDCGKDGEAEIRFNSTITLEAEYDETIESVTCTGISSRLKEARFALTENKKITKAAITLILGDDEYSFVLDSRWMNYRSFKAPKVVQDETDDPEGLFYEKAGLIEKAIAIMDAVYFSFIRLRVSPEWKKKELPSVIRWVTRGT